LVELKKTHLWPTLYWMVCMTLDCVGITQSSVIRIIHRNVGLKHFCLHKFLLLLLVFANIYISQGSVETHLPCGGIYNNHIIANCLQSVPLKECWKSSINGEDMDKSKVARFLAHFCQPHFCQNRGHSDPYFSYSNQWSTTGVLQWYWYTKVIANLSSTGGCRIIFVLTSFLTYIKLRLSADTNWVELPAGCNCSRYKHKRENT